MVFHKDLAAFLMSSFPSVKESMYENKDANTYTIDFNWRIKNFDVFCNLLDNNILVAIKRGF